MCKECWSNFLLRQYMKGCNTSQQNTKAFGEMSLHIIYFYVREDSERTVYFYEKWLASWMGI